MLVHRFKGAEHRIPPLETEEGASWRPGPSPPAMFHDVPPSHITSNLFALEHGGRKLSILSQVGQSRQLRPLANPLVTSRSREQL